VGRNAQPISVIKQKGKSHHITKKEEERRKKNEVKLGDNKLTCPNYVKNDTVAYSKWKEIIKLHKDADYLTSADAGVLGRYCKTFAEYNQLLERMKVINHIHAEVGDVDDYIADSNEDFNYKIKKKLLDIVSTDGILRIEAAINKKMDMLLKMEDRMFLNPVSRIKNVAKKEKEEKDEDAYMFGD